MSEGLYPQKFKRVKRFTDFVLIKNGVKKTISRTNSATLFDKLLKHRRESWGHYGVAPLSEIRAGVPRRARPCNPHPNLANNQCFKFIYFFSIRLILLFTLLQEEVIRKLSGIFLIILTNLFMGTEKVRTFSGTHGRADTSNIPRTALGCSESFSK
jgi:hypothetical protein